MTSYASFIVIVSYPASRSIAYFNRDYSTSHEIIAPHILSYRDEPPELPSQEMIESSPAIRADRRVA